MDHLPDETDPMPPVLASTHADIPCERFGRPHGGTSKDTDSRTERHGAKTSGHCRSMELIANDRRLRLLPGMGFYKKI